MAEKYKGIKFVDDEDAEDRELLKRMNEGRKTGVVSRDQVMKTLTGIIEK